MFLDPEAFQDNLMRSEKFSKRLPKRHLKVVQNLVKQWSKSEVETEQKKRHLCYQNIALTAIPVWSVLRPCGSSKSYLKMSSRWLKNCSRCPRTIPIWFQLGWRLPQLFKIAPNMRPHKDLHGLLLSLEVIIGSYKALYGFTKLIIGWALSSNPSTLSKYLSDLTLSGRFRGGTLFGGFFYSVRLFFG